MQLQAGWTISGIVVEHRELTSERSKTWRAYRIKLASLGATFDVDVPFEDFKSLSEGQAVVCEGRFEQRGGYNNLIATQVRDASASSSRKEAA